jgi:hypothetical protein
MKRKTGPEEYIAYMTDLGRQGWWGAFEHPDHEPTQMVVAGKTAKAVEQRLLKENFTEDHPLDLTPSVPNHDGRSWLTPDGYGWIVIVPLADVEFYEDQVWQHGSEIPVATVRSMNHALGADTAWLEAQDRVAEWWKQHTVRDPEDLPARLEAAIGGASFPPSAAHLIAYFPDVPKDSLMEAVRSARDAGRIELRADEHTGGGWTAGWVLTASAHVAPLAPAVAS